MKWCGGWGRRVVVKELYFKRNACISKFHYIKKILAKVVLGLLEIDVWLQEAQRFSEKCLMLVMFISDNLLENLTIEAIFIIPCFTMKLSTLS